MFFSPSHDAFFDKCNNTVYSLRNSLYIKRVLNFIIQEEQCFLDYVNNVNVYTMVFMLIFPRLGSSVCTVKCVLLFWCCCMKVVSKYCTHMTRLSLIFNCNWFDLFNLFSRYCFRFSPFVNFHCFWRLTFCQLAVKLTLAK